MFSNISRLPGVLVSKILDATPSYQIFPIFNLRFRCLYRLAQNPKTGNNEKYIYSQEMPIITTYSP